LITADIANSYYREVFALPGRVSDRWSSGCNRLITDNKAVLLQDTDQFIAHMGWEPTSMPSVAVQKELFTDLTEEEERVVLVLKKAESMQVNALAIELNTPVSELFFTLLELEMKDVVESLPGGMYKLM
jgi:DNA processing protein